MTFASGQKVRASALIAAIANCPQLIDKQTLSSSQPNITITVPTGYNFLEGRFTVRQDSSSGGAFCLLRINGDSGSDYTFQHFYGHSTAATVNNSGAVSSLDIGVTPGPSDPSNYFGIGEFTIGNASAATFKPVTGCFHCAVSSSNAYSGTSGGLWLSTAAITSVVLLPSSGNLVSGSEFSLYGRY